MSVNNYPVISQQNTAMYGMNNGPTSYEPGKVNALFTNDFDSMKYHLAQQGMFPSNEELASYVKSMQIDRSKVEYGLKSLFNHVWKDYGHKNPSYQSFYKRAMRDAHMFDVKTTDLPMIRMHYDHATGSGNENAPLQVLKKSPMSNQLGLDIAPMQIAREIKEMKVDEKTKTVQQEIVKMANETRQQTPYIRMMSNMFKNGNAATKINEAFTPGPGTNMYNIHNQTQKMGNPLSFVHPVDFAMFFKKVPAYESRFLNTDFAEMMSDVIQFKHNNILMNESNLQMFDDMIRTPHADSICSNDIWDDMKLRAEILNGKRVTLTNFRNGVLFDAKNYDLILKMNGCRTTPYTDEAIRTSQNPLAYAKRLFDLAVFKPIRVQTFSASGSVITPMQQMSHVTSGTPTPNLYGTAIQGSDISRTSMMHVNLASDYVAQILTGGSDPTVELENVLKLPQLVTNSFGQIKHEQVGIVDTNGQLIFSIERGDNTLQMMADPKTTKVNIPKTIEATKIGSDFVKMHSFNYDMKKKDLDYKLHAIVTLNGKIEGGKWKRSLNQQGGMTFIVDPGTNTITHMYDPFGHAFGENEVSKDIPVVEISKSSGAPTTIDDEFIKKNAVLVFYTQDMETKNKLLTPPTPHSGGASGTGASTGTSGGASAPSAGGSSKEESFDDKIAELYKKELELMPELREYEDALNTIKREIEKNEDKKKAIEREQYIKTNELVREKKETEITVEDSKQIKNIIRNAEDSFQIINSNIKKMFKKKDDINKEIENISNQLEMINRNIDAILKEKNKSADAKVLSTSSTSSDSSLRLGVADSAGKS